MKKQNNTEVWTLFELWLGIILYFVIFEVAGLIFSTNQITYTLGLLTGCLTAGLLAWNLYSSIGAVLDLDAADAEKSSIKNSIIRMLIMLVIVLAGMKFSILSFPAVVIGIFSLKISAFFQPYTHLCITKKIMEKRGR